MIIEEPFLSGEAVSSLQDDAVVNDVEVSSTGHLCDNGEFLLNDNTKLWVELSRLVGKHKLISISDDPLLGLGVSEFADSDIRVLVISVSLDLDNQASFVHEVVAFDSEHLEPPSVGLEKP
jgi:hypothetical protein